MFEFYSTPLDILYLALTIVVSLLGLFLVIAVFHIVRILGNIHKVSSKAKDTMDLLNHYLWQPIKIAMMILEKMKTATGKSSKKNS